MSKNASFRIEYATSDGDACAECKRKFYAGELRIGRVVTTSGGRTSVAWYHPVHLFEAMRRWKPTSRRLVSVDELEGVESLRPSDARYITNLVAGGDELVDILERLSLHSAEETKRGAAAARKPRSSTPPRRARSPSAHTSPARSPPPSSRRRVSSGSRSRTATTLPPPLPKTVGSPRRSPTPPPAPVRRDQTAMHDWKGDEAPPHLSQAERERWYEARRRTVWTSRPIDMLHRRYVTKAKFWEVDVRGKTVVTRWGPIGKTGQTLSQAFANEDKARAYATAKIKEKARHGYLAEVTSAEL